MRKNNFREAVVAEYNHIKQKKSGKVDAANKF
jgi:hypothetical protein